MNHSKPFSNPVFRGQLIAHVSIIPMILYAHAWQYGIAVMIYFLSGCFGMSMTYHRFLSHRSWRCPRWFEILGTFFGTIALTGSSLAWCAVHLDHHAHTDQVSDPHSPKHQSFWKVQFLSMMYRPKLRYTRDLIRDRFHRFVHRYYIHINLVYAIILMTISPFALIYAWLFPAALVWNAGSAINTLGHTFGYGSHDKRDESRNNLIIGYLAWGEGWHNNHHRYPGSAFFGRKWYELDLSAIFIRAFQGKQLAVAGPTRSRLGGASISVASGISSPGIPSVQTLVDKWDGLNFRVASQLILVDWEVKCRLYTG